MKNFPLKQVHLDFHTSPDIPGIGSHFDKTQFQTALKVGKLESITVFAKCHHGLCYYPTKVGTMHPGLDFDLTGAMIDAAHEIGVRAPIYITAGWSDLDAKQHPEWIMRNRDGSQHGNPAMLKNLGRCENDYREEVAWDNLCLNDGAYCRHIYALTEEVCSRYPVVDGLFFDICALGPTCHCDECLAGMAEMGIDPDDPKAAHSYFNLKHQAFMENCGKILHRYHPDATIFFNTGGANMNMPQFHRYQTHYEMEDLPTCWHGYDRLSVRAKYFSLTGKPYLAMTGKFHLDWGEFGGFKCKEALKYEVCAIALYGAGCSIGDHMHPDGEMEMQTYENIGYAYDHLDRIAPYCYGGTSTARIGMVKSASPDAYEGLAKILIENQIEFELVSGNNLAPFQTVIVPEGVKYDDFMIAGLKDYIAKGGRLLFCADSLVRDGQFAIDCGAEYISAPEFDCDYIQTDIPYRQELPNAPMLCNFPGHVVKLTDGQVLGQITPPYFSRTMGHFCGHKNTPFNKDAERYPGIVRKGNVVYMAHPMASAYNTFGSLYQKRYLMLALEQIFTGGAFRITGLGSMGRATMIHQQEQRRYCLNMVYASPVKRGRAQVIEDIMPVYHISVQLDVPQTIRRAYLPLTGEELSITEKDGFQSLMLPKLECHASIVLEY